LGINNRSIWVKGDRLPDHDKAIALKPDYATPYLNRGNLYQYKGQLEAAMADYDKPRPTYAAAKLFPTLLG
jgi:tetratricopeptide (TPR) repeat protein